MEDSVKKDDSVFKDFWGKLRLARGLTLPDYKHDSVIKNLLYCICLLAAALAVWGAFIILKPFLSPLLWALLCGFILHPFKFALCTHIKDGINSMHTPYILPIVIDITCFPLHFLIRLSDAVAKVTVQHWKSMIIIISLITLFMFTPQICVNIFSFTVRLFFTYVDVLLNIFSSKILVLTMIIALIVIIYLPYSWDNQRIAYTTFSVITWFAVFCYISSIFGILKLPVFIIIHVLITFGLISGVSDPVEHESDKSNNSNVPSGDMPSEDIVKFRSQRALSDVSFRTFRITDYMKQVSPENIRSKSTSDDESKKDVPTEENYSDLFLYWVIGACFFTLLTRFWWIPLFILLLAFVYLVRSIYIYVGIEYIVMNKLYSFQESIHSWLDHPTGQILIPTPVKAFYKTVVIIKIKLITYLLNSADAISTIIVMLSVIVFITVALVFLTTQVYGEGMYLVQVGSKVINDSMFFNPELMQSLPEDWKDQIDYTINNAYLYGRDVLSKLVHKAVSDGDSEKVRELETIVLELWDRVYQAWFINSYDNTVTGPKVTSEAVYQMWDQLTSNVKNTPSLGTNAVMNFVNDNMAILLSTTSAVWEFVKDNVGLVLYLLQNLLYVVFISSSTVFGFFIDIVVFLTALFYLLNSSGTFYKPMEFIRNVSPVYGTKLASAMERSVTEVFMVSSKLAVFYGLYTWLIHTLFQVPLVYIPTVLAAIFAAIPLVSTYWVCLPAVIDLWLIRGNPFNAVLLFVLQFAPTNIVDTTIYEDIHGGHPYLTGLSMAGGVLCFGIQGAIIGPLILCFMFVIFKFGTFLMKESEATNASPQH